MQMQTKDMTFQCGGVMWAPLWALHDKHNSVDEADDDEESHLFLLGQEMFWLDTIVSLGWVIGIFKVFLNHGYFAWSIS